MSDKNNSIDLGGEGQSFAFDEIGDRVVGKIISFEQMQQTDMETNEPKFWPGGQPMTMVRVDLRTKLRDDATDDGMRSVYLRGSKKASSQSSMAAVLSAMKEATGGTTLQVGAIMSLELVGEEKPKRRGHNGRKLYEAVYKPPAVNLADDEEEKPARRKPQPVDDDEDDRPAPRQRRRAEPEDDELDDERPARRTRRQRDDDDELDDEPAPRSRRSSRRDDDFDDEPPVRSSRRRAPIDDDEDEPDERPVRRQRRRPPIDDDFDEDELKV